jgi:thiol-disulfide isomerase/thioredoxin
MTASNQQRLGKTLWAIADQLRGAMSADDFRDYMLAFLFLRYLSDNYEAAAKKELGSDYPKFAADDPRVPLAIWYANNPGDIVDFEKQMRRKVHYVIKPDHLWANIANLARNQSDELLETLKKGFDYIENESFDSTFQGLFSEINLYSEKLGKTQPAKNKTLCGIIKEIAKGLTIFDFTSPYCPPCRYIGPHLDSLHREDDGVVVVKVEINRPGGMGDSPVGLVFSRRNTSELPVRQGLLYHLRMSITRSPADVAQVAFRAKRQA